MCQLNNKEILHNEVYTNIQTGEVLDWERVNLLPDNALLKVRPELWIEWDFEKNGELGLDIWKMTKGMEKISWWICKKCSSSFDTVMKKRSKKNNICPYCHGKRINHTNSLSSKNPSLALEWHSTLNGNLTPNDVTCSTHTVAWWHCSICKSDYDSKISDKNKGNGCPYCAGKRVNESNSLATLYPNLASEWHPSLNNKLTPNDVVCGNNSKAWWICPNCNSEYDMIIALRTSGCNCPYCSGNRVNHTNSLAVLNPQLFSEWHPSKNGDLTPYDVTLNSNEKVWWLGTCGHEWNTTVAHRNEGKGCPYCSNQKILIGFNDMWTTNPELASMLVDTEDGYKYSMGSNQKVDWICPNCGEEIKNKAINKSKEKLHCINCSDSVSYPEKIMFYLLKELDIDYINDAPFSWSNLKRYDFYIPSLNLIIETHGGQHYKQTTRKGARTLEEEQSNDKYKQGLALSNGIKNYIVIDCRNSEIEWIKNNILDSDLSNIFELSNIDWSKLHTQSQKSMNIEILELHNEGFKPSEISEITNIKLSKVKRILNKLGIYQRNIKY